MGRITVTDEPEQDLTVIALHGDVTLEELDAGLAEVRRRPVRATFQIWDYTNGTLGAPKGDVVARLAAAYRDGVRTGGKTAFVCPRDIQFGLARMFVIYAESHKYPVAMQAFRDMAAARVWLGVPTDRAAPC